MIATQRKMAGQTPKRTSQGVSERNASDQVKMGKSSMTSTETDAPKGESVDFFSTTSWTVVAKVGTHSEAERQNALEHLCIQYRPSIEAYLRASRVPVGEVEDLVQQFFLFILSSNAIERADRNRGKFRAFLLVCLQNFLINEKRKSSAQKRGGNYVFVEFDERMDSSIDAKSPSAAFDKKWAETVIKTSVDNLKEEWESNGKAFESLREYVVSPKAAIPLNEKAEELGVSVPALKSAVFRLRRRYGDIIREVIAETVQSQDSVEEELKEFLAILSS